VASSDQIRLALPAEPEYGRLARITAAGLALRLGFRYAEIEDLRLAIDETLILLLDPDGTSGVVTVIFDPLPDGIAIDASTSAEVEQDERERAERLQRFETIVGPIVESVTVGDDGRRVQLKVLHPEK
jgi:serine/threonine-protein kinase RsbW